MKILQSEITKQSLWFQLLSRILIILAVLLVLIGLLQYVFMRDIIYRSRASSLTAQIMSMPPEVVFKTDVDNDGEYPRPPRLFSPDTTLARVDENGNVSALMGITATRLPPILDKKTYQKALRNRPEDGQPRQDYIIAKDQTGEEQLVVLKPDLHEIGGNAGLLQISTPTGPLKELLTRQLLTFFGLALAALLAAILVFRPFLNRVLVPLYAMVDTAEQIDAGNLDRRFPTRQGQEEIDRLADSCNGMLDRLEESFLAEQETKEQMRRFIADASHELRTPLTSIHGFLEVLLRGAANQPDQLHRSLKSMYGESERLNKLVNDLLLLAKLDRTPRVELSEGALDQVVKEMEPQLRVLAGARNLRFAIDSDLKCRFEADKMKQVVLNLFQNAVQHTDPETGDIRLTLTGEDRNIVLRIEDNGPGISEETIGHIFDRFYRSDSSRTRRSGGAGLGLAITKTIVEVHGGSIQAESREGEGAVFIVRLPTVH